MTEQIKIQKEQENVNPFGIVHFDMSWHYQ